MTSKAKGLPQQRSVSNALKYELKYSRSKVRGRRKKRRRRRKKGKRRKRKEERR